MVRSLCRLLSLSLSLSLSPTAPVAFGTAFCRPLPFNSNQISNPILTQFLIPSRPFRCCARRRPFRRRRGDCCLCFRAWFQLSMRARADPPQPHHGRTAGRCRCASFSRGAGTFLFLFYIYSMFSFVFLYHFSSVPRSSSSSALSIGKNLTCCLYHTVSHLTQLLVWGIVCHHLRGAVRVRDQAA